jgi:hypothetical protein
LKTITQHKIALTPFDDKHNWKANNESVPWGYDDPPYDENEVMERIVENCAKCVKISKDKFLEYLGCTKAEFKQHLESYFSIGWSFMNYGSIWNIDHEDPVKGKNLKDEKVVGELCHYTNLIPKTLEDNSSKNYATFGPKDADVLTCSRKKKDIQEDNTKTKLTEKKITIEEIIKLQTMEIYDDLTKEELVQDDNIVTEEKTQLVRDDNIITELVQGDNIMTESTEEDL